MTRAGCMFERNHVIAGLGCLLWISLSAQEPTLRVTKDGVTTPTPEVLSPLREGLPKPPVELFRNLLTMTAQERQGFLAHRSPETQKLILAKIREYQELNPEQRELRLRVTELRWYLLPLLNTAATNRNAQLTLVPAELRPLVDNRLEQWDNLTAEARKQVLENESTVRFNFELAAATPERRAETMAHISGADREKLEAGLQRWQALPESQRREIVRHFQQYFELTPAEKERTLQTLSEPERLQIEKTLSLYEGLTPAQRSQCLKSFQKFASLTPEQRRQFLKDAEHWKLMTPSERQSWRNLVYTLSRQPPLPPGLSPPPVPQPPALKTLTPAGSRGAWATNSN